MRSHGQQRDLGVTPPDPGGEWRPRTAATRCCKILDRRRLTPAAPGQLLGLERRQVFRLLKAYRIEGPIGLISKRRGRRSYTHPQFEAAARMRSSKALAQIASAHRTNGR
jgi:hypothetical protein